MITAKIAFDAMLGTTQDMLDFNQSEMDAAEADSSDWYTAMGAYTAWKAMQNKMTEIKGAGFEPDAVDIATTKTEMMTEHAENMQRALRIRQSTAKARDLYNEFWEVIRGYGKGKTDMQLGDLDPSIAFAYLNGGIFNAITQEWTPEQEAATEAALQHLANYLEAMKVWVADALSGAGPIIH